MTSRSNIEVGATFSFEHTFERTDEKLFEELTGDRTFLENDRGRIVHGMLAASLFSTLIDEHCPFGDNLYVQQTLNFRRPILYGSYALIRGTITAYSIATNVSELRTEIIVDETVAIDGEAKVRLI